MYVPFSVFCVLFCVNVYCYRVSTQFQLSNNNNTLVLKGKDEHTPVLIDFVKIVSVCGAQNLKTIETE
jgi:hypothetical protein